MSIKLRIINVLFSFQYLPLARYDQHSGNEKDSSVQLSMVANWSSFLGSSRPCFINIDFAGLFIVFAEVCTIISAGSSALMIKLGIQIKNETLTFQPVIIPTYIPAENWENARYIFMDTYSVTVVPQRQSSFLFQTFFSCIRESSGSDTIINENQDHG